VITKADLLPYVPFKVKDAETDALQVQPGLKIFTLSSQTGDGVSAWCEFLRRERHRLLKASEAEEAGKEVKVPARTGRSAAKPTIKRPRFSHSGISKKTKAAKS
jgi:hypothetical protein